MPHEREPSKQNAPAQENAPQQSSAEGGTSSSPPITSGGALPPVAEANEQAPPLTASERRYGGGAGKASSETATSQPQGEITVSAGGIVKLGSGLPRNQLQEAISTTVDGWAKMIDNLTGAVGQFVDTVQHSQLRSAEPGLLAELWARAQPLLTQAAAFVTGTPLYAELGINAIQRVIAYGDLLEQQRINADGASFIAELRRMEGDLKAGGPFEGASRHEVVSQLDAEFEQIGKNHPEDAWKLGDKAVVGAQAAFINELKARSNAYLANVPKQQAFVAKFLEGWITAHHKQRKRSALRSPFDESTYQDGFIEVKTSIHYDPSFSGWFIAHGTFATAKLHCPKSAEVAGELKQTVNPFDLDQLDVPMVIEVRVTDSAWERMPARWKNQREHRVHVRNGVVTSGAREFWRWAMQETGKGTREILAGVTTLDG